MVSSSFFLFSFLSYSAYVCVLRAINRRPIIQSSGSQKNQEEEEEEEELLSSNVPDIIAQGLNI